MLPSLRNLQIVCGSLLLAAGIVFLGFRVDRMDFWQVLPGFVVAFAGYFLLIARRRTGSAVPAVNPLRLLIGLGILLRLALLFAFPLLSDDVYRFLWDGYLINAGLSPFSELPAYYLESGREVAGLSQELFDRLNSPTYHTIYPPVAQAVFTLATALFADNWFAAALVMKLVLLLGELGTLALLWRMLPRWKRPRQDLLLYWLNPLILIEIMGNLHFEGLMICFLLAALWWLSSGRVVRAGIAFALSVATKLLPLMLLPFLIVRLWRRESSRPFWIFSLVFGFSCLLLFSPLLLSDFVQNFGSSLDLYFRKFEFNASVYYLVRAYGYYEIGWNQIARFGPLLGKLAAAGILALAAWEAWQARARRRSTDSLWRILPKWWLLAFSLYLLLATTVHPWYLAVPIVLCCFTGFRYPLVWSFFIVLTYASYTSVPYRENYWFVGLEYLAVIAYFIYELWQFGRRRMRALPRPTISLAERE